MMPTRMDFGIVVALVGSSSPTCGTLITSRSSAREGMQVAQRAGGGGDQVHGDAEPLAVHAAGIADAAAAVDAVADGDRVDEAAVVAAVVLVAMVEGAPEIGVTDLVAGDVDVDGDG